MTLHYINRAMQRFDFTAKQAEEQLRMIRAHFAGEKEAPRVLVVSETYDAQVISVPAISKLAGRTAHIVVSKTIDERTGTLPILTIYDPTPVLLPPRLEREKSRRRSRLVNRRRHDKYADE